MIRARVSVRNWWTAGPTCSGRSFMCTLTRNSEKPWQRIHTNKRPRFPGGPEDATGVQALSYAWLWPVGTLAGTASHFAVMRVLNGRRVQRETALTKAQRRPFATDTACQGGHRDVVAATSARQPRLPPNRWVAQPRAPESIRLLITYTVTGDGLVLLLRFVILRSGATKNLALRRVTTPKWRFFARTERSLRMTDALSEAVGLEAELIPALDC